MIKRWCIPPEGCAIFVAAMEGILRLYALPPDPLRPLVCLDEFSKQLLSEVTPALGPSPGKDRREDAEYVREGSATGFMIAAPHLGTRQVYVGKDARRTSLDFADAIKFLCDEMFPEAEEIQLVVDNLNTHTTASLYKRFPPEEAARLASKIRLHFTPKHGSWLNIAEIEISVLSRSALDLRIPDTKTFKSQIKANIERRNQSPAPVNWQFTNEHARIKLAGLYPPL